MYSITGMVLVTSFLSPASPASFSHPILPAHCMSVDEGISSSLRPASSRSNHFLNALEPTTKSSVHEATGDISNSNLTVTVIHTGELTS